MLVLGSLLFFGLCVMLLIYALLPEYPPKHKARLRLASQLPAHRATAPDWRCYQGSDVLTECDRPSMSLIW